MIVFEKCDPAIRFCKSETEITKWLEFKYIITYQNSRNFIQHDFSHNRINELAAIQYFALNPTGRID